MKRKAKTDSNQSERLFLFVAVPIALIFGAGFYWLLASLNHRPTIAGSGYENLPDSQAVALTPDHPRHLVPFTLRDQSDHKITQADLHGKFLVVSFLFTSCSLTCPIVSGQMAKIQELTTNQPDVQLVSLTVDPEDDTVPVLAKYGQNYDAQSNRWMFLTGQEHVIQNLIGTSFLSADTNSVFSYMPGSFSHIERIALVDPHGKVRAYFDGLNQNVATAVVSEINQLRKENL